MDSNNDSQDSHRKSWHFLTSTSSLLNSALVSSFLRLGGSRLLLKGLMLSNPETLFLLRTSTEFLIALYIGGLFGLIVKLYLLVYLMISKVHFEKFLGLTWCHLLLYWWDSQFLLGFPLILTDASISAVGFPLKYKFSVLE